MNIYIPIEIKARELEGRGLLAIVAAERGHTVILGSKGDTRGLVKKGKVPPGILHEKSLTPSSYTVEYLQKLVENGYKVTSQDEESGLVLESYEPFAKARFSAESISQAARVFTWGSHDLKALNHFYSEFENRFSVTGSPRVDFWRKDFAPYYKIHDANGQLNGKPYILIASNFTGLLDRNRIWDKMARMRNAGYFDRDPEREFHEYGNNAFKLELAGHFVKMIRELASRFPEISVIFRPHPVESTEIWEKLLGDHPNILIRRKGSISGWIRNAVLMIHNGSTSAFEAAACGVPRIAYSPVKSEFENEMPNRISYSAESLSGILDMVSDILNGRSLSQDSTVALHVEEVLGSRFANLNGGLAADRIVDEWEKLDDFNASDVVSISELLEIKKSGKKSLVKTLKQQLVKVRDQLLPSGEVDQEPLLNNSIKFPSFTDEEMDRLLMNLRKSLNRFHNVEYRRFGKKSFLLYSK